MIFLKNNGFRLIYIQSCIKYKISYNIMKNIVYKITEPNYRDEDNLVNAIEDVDYHYYSNTGDVLTSHQQLFLTLSQANMFYHRYVHA